MTTPREPPLEELDAAIGRSVCHDLSGTVGALSTNASIASEMLTGDSDVQELRAVVEDIRTAIARLEVHVEDLRDVLAARGTDRVVSLATVVESALRMARRPLAEAHVTVVVALDGPHPLPHASVSRGALVRALARTLAALAAVGAFEIAVRPGTSDEHLALDVRAAGAEDAIGVHLASVRRDVEAAGGSLRLTSGATYQRVRLRVGDRTA